MPPSPELASSPDCHQTHAVGCSSCPRGATFTNKGLTEQEAKDHLLPSMGLSVAPGGAAERVLGGNPEQ